MNNTLHVFVGTNMHDAEDPKMIDEAHDVKATDEVTGEVVDTRAPDEDETFGRSLPPPRRRSTLRQSMKSMFTLGLRRPEAEIEEQRKHVSHRVVMRLMGFRCFQFCALIFCWGKMELLVPPPPRRSTLRHSMESMRSLSTGS